MAHEGPVRDMEQAQAAVATVGNRQAAAIRCEPHAVWSQQLPIQAPWVSEATSQYTYRGPAAPCTLEQPHQVVIVRPRADGHQGASRRHAPGPGDGAGCSHVPHVRSTNHVDDMHRVKADVGE